jgi:broad specificity phosphatase PhoE
MATLARATKRIRCPFTCFHVRNISSVGSDFAEAYYGNASTHRQFLPNQYDRVKRIILVRHGESAGNTDEKTYVTTADWRIPLTKKGQLQAEESGKLIRDLIGEPANGEKLFFYVSPYMRTRQTLKRILKHLTHDQVIGVREEPRISEQQFGNFQCVDSVLQAKEERKNFGRFYYRFPNGEAGFDVYSRVTSFISTLMRDSTQLRASGHDIDKVNLCIVTHGLTLRLFLTRWFQFSVQEFEDSYNPSNGAVIVLERRTHPTTGLQWFEIVDQKQLDHLNFPSHKDQSRFRIMDDIRNFDDDFTDETV